MAVINRDSATLTRNYVSGASVNVHGDVLGLGVINGGLITTGAGSGTTEYLTKASGLGYTPANTTYWGISGVPVQVGDALDKLAKRAYDLETSTLAISAYNISYVPTTSSDWLSPVPSIQQDVNDQLASRTKALEVVSRQEYIDSGMSYSSSTLSTDACEFDVYLNTGTQTVNGPSIFSRTGSGLMYNGSASQSFFFKLSFPTAVTWSSSSVTMIQQYVDIIRQSDSAVLARFENILPLYVSSKFKFDTQFERSIALSPLDVILLHFTFLSESSTTFTACQGNIFDGTPFYSLRQYT